MDTIGANIEDGTNGRRKYVDSTNSSDGMDSINKKALAVFITVVLVVLALAVWGGTLLGKSQAANQNQELSTKVLSAQGQLSQLQSASASLQKDNDALQAHLSSAQGQLSQLQSQYGSLQDTNVGLQTQLSSAQGQLSQLQSQYSSLQATNAGLRTQLSSAQGQLSQLQSQYSSLQATNTALQSQLSSVQQQIAALQAQLAAWYAWASKAPLIPATSGPSITLSPTSAPMGTSITVTGSGFAANISGNVIFDINRNGTSDPGEPLQNVTTSLAGTFSTTLVVPSVPPSTYPVLAAFPTGATAQASANFAVTIGAGS